MSVVKPRTKTLAIDAEGMHYKILNEKIKLAAKQGIIHVKIINVNGQRYIGTGVNSPINIEISGVPGSDLAAFMDGPKITIHNNAQDAIGNTMSGGEIIIHGRAGDVVGYAMRGGEIFIEGDVGYRVGIHMKSFETMQPVIVVGGVAHDFLGEYMAGGKLIVLNSKNVKDFPSNYIGTGMHGGVIYLRGEIDPHQLGKEVSVVPLEDSDMAEIKRYVHKYARYFHANEKDLLKGKFIKLVALSHRPYGRLYAY